LSVATGRWLTGRCSADGGIELNRTVPLATGVGRIPSNEEQIFSVMLLPSDVERAGHFHPGAS
jgi:hypothetical protein